MKEKIEKISKLKNKELLKLLKAIVQTLPGKNLDTLYEFIIERYTELINDEIKRVGSINKCKELSNEIGTTKQLWLVTKKGELKFKTYSRLYPILKKIKKD